ncbi:MAG: hypothetical protein RJQ01_10690 [Microcella sp.]|uniref:hypothetical protein n=1 Tax=Microcella sp. TaxID=1913979 RepID=UPI0033148DD4
MSGTVDDDPDTVGPSWQPDPERDGYERWFDGEQLVGHSVKEPDPFSAFSPEVARSLRPAVNRDARLARLGIPLTILGFATQLLVASGLVSVAGVDGTALVLVALAVAATLAALTAVFAARGLHHAPRRGGKGISSLALGVSIILGLAPVLLLVAVGLAGGAGLPG